VIGGDDAVGGGPPDAPARVPALEARLAALEARLAALADEVRTRRVALVGDGDQERLVAEVVAGVTELRLDLPGCPPGRRTSLLVFAAPEQPDWCAGLGVQLWVGGNLVDELSWWEDQEKSSVAWPHGQAGGG
jgi:hypothetical protein